MNGTFPSRNMTTVATRGGDDRLTVYAVPAFLVIAVLLLLTGFASWAYWNERKRRIEAETDFDQLDREEEDVRAFAAATAAAAAIDNLSSDDDIAAEDEEEAKRI